MFENFWGHPHVTRSLQQMLESRRLPQTLLFAGPEGVGKATLARRLGAALLGRGDLIEQDDLSLPNNLALIADREKWPAEQRNQDPLLFASHPDFVTFPPDGPLRQISIPQARLLKERAVFKPSRGDRRIFLIDQVDRAGEQAANSLLKTLEEPPNHLVLIMTAQNAYNLLPTIRSRAVPFYFGSLPKEEMHAFATVRGLKDAERRIALSGGSPGIAISLDLDSYVRRRASMLTLLKVAARSAPFSAWAQQSENLFRSKSEKLDFYLKILYDLLRDLLLLHQAVGEIRNQDVRPELETLARKVSFQWIRAAVQLGDDLAELIRRNIQKTIALDAMIIQLQTLVVAKS